MTDALPRQVRGRTTAPPGLVLGHEITGEVVEIGSDVLHVKKEGIVSVLDEWDLCQPSDVEDVPSTTAPWSCGLIEFIFVAEVSEATLCVPALRVN